MFLIESTVALPSFIDRGVFLSFPFSQQQPRSQVLPGHQSSERRRVPFRHQ